MTSRVFVTGGAGFIGRDVVRRLRERGDEVIAVVRDPAPGDRRCRDLGVRLVASDLGSDGRDPRGDGRLRRRHPPGRLVPGRDHARPSARRCTRSTWRSRRGCSTPRSRSGIPRIVAISTANVFGDTKGRLVNETYRRDPADGYLSYYDETKVLAHRIAEARIADGAPVLIAMPGTTYGPGDHSAIGAQLKAAFDGRALAIVFGDMGISAVHVDDLAAGILAVLDRGRIGESYLLTGECLTLGGRDGRRGPRRRQAAAASPRVDRPAPDRRTPRRGRDATRHAPVRPGRGAPRRATT